MQRLPRRLPKLIQQLPSRDRCSRRQGMLACCAGDSCLSMQLVSGGASLNAAASV